MPSHLMPVHVSLTAYFAKRLQCVLHEFFVALNVVQFAKYGCVNPYCFMASTIMYVRDE